MSVFRKGLHLGVLLSGFLAAACLPGVADAQVTSDWVTMRPPGAGFRILMPPDWETTTPRGRNTRILIRPRQSVPSGRPGFANCNVVVRAEPSLSGLSQAELDADVLANPLSTADARNMTGTLSNLTIRENRTGRVNNRPAYIVVASGDYETVNAKVHMVMAQAFVFRPGTVLAANCGAGGGTSEQAEAAWAAWRPVLMAVLGTWVLED